MQLIPPIRWVRRLILAAVVLAALAGAYAVLGFVVIPRLLRSEATSFVSAHYHRTLSLGDIRFNPFTLTLDISDLSLPGASSTPMLGAAGVHVNLSSASLWRRAVSFSDIVLDRPFARVLIRPDGSMNLADLARPFAPAGGPQSSRNGSKPFRLYIDRFTIIDGQTTYEDRSRETPFRTELENVTLALRDFSTIAGSANEYSLDFATALGARFHWRGKLATNPLASSGKFTISTLQARTLASYLGRTLPFEVSSGVIALAGDYDFTAAAKPFGLVVDVPRLSVSDLGVKPPDAPSDYADLKLLEIGDTRVDVAKHSLSIGSVRLTGGALRTWIDAGGHLNLTALLGRPSSASGRVSAAPSSSGSAAASGPASPPAGAWSISVPEIAIDGLRLTAEDREVAPAAALTVDPITLHVEGYHSPGPAALRIAARAAVDRSGRLDVKATYALGSGAARAEVSLDRIDLTALQPYVARYSALDLLSGDLAAELRIDEPAGGPLTATGRVAVTRLRTVDDQLRQDFVKWDRLTLDGIRYRSRPASLAIRTITAAAPYARVIVSSDRKINIAEALSPQHAHAPPPSRGGAQPASGAPAQHGAAAASSMAISIGRVKVERGSARYTDLWIEPHFYLAIQGLSGSIAGLSSDPRSRATVELNGKVDRYAPISISGKVNLFSATRYTDMKMSFHGVELTSATPYSAHFAGYRIDKGTMSADITYHIENGELSADHNIVIDQLQLGQRVESPDAVKWPLKLAVALLKDRNGVIKLGLPISGSLDNPQFRLGPLIWKVLGNLIVKAATAPFALLGKLVGGGEQMKFIDFDAGSASLDAASRARLAKIAEALAQRPQLKLNVPSGYDVKLDRDVLARAMVLRQIAAVAPAGPRTREHAPDTVGGAALADPATRFSLLVADYRKVLGAKTPLPASAETIVDARRRDHRDRGSNAVPPTELEPAIDALESALAARVEVPVHDLERLGRRRASAVQGVLLTGTHLDPGRLFVLGTAANAKSDGSRVRLELSLQ